MKKLRELFASFRKPKAPKDHTYFSQPFFGRTLTVRQSGLYVDGEYKRPLTEMEKQDLLDETKTLRIEMDNFFKGAL